MITVEICIGTACHLMGSEEIFKAIEQLPPELKKKIKLSGTSCLGHCDRGPVVRINGELYQRITPSQLKTVLKELGGQER
jgi:NADH:ubiquinone oxidoreductase subunit E